MENMRKIISAIALFIGIGMISSCVSDWKQFIEEDIDNLVVDSINIQPAFALHIGTAEFKISDLIEEKQDTLMFVGEDSLITFNMSIDTLYEMSVADVYEMPTVDPIGGQTFSMDELKIEDLSAELNVLLSEVLTSAGYSGPTTGTIPFPPISNVPAGDYAYEAFDSFQEVVFASGEFTIEMTNNTPLTVSVVMALRNSDGTYVGNDVNFSDIAPHTTARRTVDVAGEKMTNEVTGEIKSFSTPGAGPLPNTVTLDGSESFYFVVSTSKELVVATATAKIPLTEIVDSTMVSITPEDNPGLNITTLKLSTGRIDFTVNSGFAAPMIIDLEMPYTKTAEGVTLTKSFTFSNGGSQTQSLDLSNTTTDLTMNGDSSNIFFVKYSAAIGGDDQLYTFSSPATVSIDATFDNVNFDYIEGSLGVIDPFEIAHDTLDLGIGDLSSMLTGEIRITNPSIRLTVFNSFGFGAHLDLLVKGFRDGNTNADTVELVLPNTDIGAATAVGEDQFTEIPLNSISTNGTLVDLIALPPKGIIFGGAVSVPNPDNIFVSGNSRVLTGIEINIPLEINLKNVAFSDTITWDAESVPAEVNAVTLILKTTNGFPLEIGLNVDVYDSIDNVILRTISIKNNDGEEILLAAAAVDASGNVTPAINELRIKLEQADFESLQKANALILKATLNTFDAVSENGVPFNANSKLKIDIAIAAQADLNTK